MNEWLNSTAFLKQCTATMLTHRLYHHTALLAQNERNKLCPRGSRRSVTHWYLCPCITLYIINPSGDSNHFPGHTVHLSQIRIVFACDIHVILIHGMQYMAHPYGSLLLDTNRNMTIISKQQRPIFVPCSASTFQRPNLRCIFIYETTRGPSQ